MTKVKTTSLSPMRCRAAIPSMVAYWLLASPRQAHASFLQGEALDTVADVMSWIVIVIVPAVLITVFWLLHIMPEKIAEKRHHPQAKAIQCLCLLSLFFGGLLWPIAWLWAYSKPVLYKLAYGTDKADPHELPPEAKPPVPATAPPVVAETSVKKEGGQS